MSKLILISITLLILTSNLQANKLAGCAAVFYISSELFREIGEYKEAENNNKISKVLGSVLVENYGQKKAEYLIESEINALKENITEKTAVRTIVNKAIECSKWLKKE